MGRKGKDQVVIRGSVGIYTPHEAYTSFLSRVPHLFLAPTKMDFSSWAHILDPRLLRALADLGFARPTLVQAKAIPIALDGKDILARARTGSGKTAAYCIPVVQKILSAKSVCRSVFMHTLH